ncbi:MAG TPA: hypothetical protein VFZ72_11130 [Jiangellaceae bacterium]
MSDTSAPRPYDPAAGAIAAGYQLAWRQRWLLLVAEPVSPPGFHVTFGDGAPPEQWLTSLIHCRDLLCEDSSRMPLTYEDEPPQATALLVGADRRVFVRTSGSGEGTTITLRLPGQ